MFSAERSGFRFVALAVLFLQFFACLCIPKARGQTSNTTSDANNPGFQLKVTSNLVVVRVVVRDAKGTPVEGLTKSDFKLFDRGQEQTIAQFEAQSSLASAPVSVAPGQAAPTALPENFLALYFDDLHASVADLNQARDAAIGYLSAHLQPGDRVAIFSSSGMLSDFTSDPKQIHDALLKLRVSPRAASRIQECPQLSDYQASEIARTPLYDPNVDAWKVARHDAYECAETSRVPWEALEPVVRAQAMRIVDQARFLARTDLDGLDFAVGKISQMPGRRTVILVSPGFLSEDEQSPLDRVIDHALRSQVVISSMDPQGMAVLMREGDASQHDLPGGDISGSAFSLDKTRALSAAGVLQDVAYGTGGVYFRNSNDLKAGFAALAGSPAYYILAFAPKNVKLDGQFHELKLELSEKQKGLSVQARRGYFASPNQPESVASESKSDGAGTTGPPAGTPSATDPAVHDQIREALFAKTDTTQLAVTLNAKVEEQGASHQLSLSSHLDGKGLPFHKDGETSTNTVTFVFGVFDPKGTLLSAQQRHVDLTVPDRQMPSFLQAGVGEDASFDLKPGSYRVRLVVIDSAEHHVTTLSRSVKIP